MKRLFLSTTAVLIGLLIVSISALSVGRQQAGAQGVEETPAPELVDHEVIPDLFGEIQLASAGNNRIEYYLPYPGILPDHPLYVFKMLRDRARLLTARGHQQLDLLQLYADKRIGAAEVLVKGGKTEMGASTADKAEGYLQQLLAKIPKEDTQRLDTLSKAVAKHDEILQLIKEKDADNENLHKAIETNTRVREGLSGMGYVVTRPGVTPVNLDESIVKDLEGLVEQNDQTSPKDIVDAEEEYKPVEIGM